MINEIIKKLNIPGKLIFLNQYGSHLYGLEGPNSDLDFRGVYIPNLNDLILHKDKDEINEEIEIDVYGGTKAEYNPYDYTYYNRDFVPDQFVKWKKVKVDIKVFSLQRFIQLCAKADTNALDLLFSWNTEHVEQYESNAKHESSILGYIYKNRDKLINTGDLYHLIKYAHSQEKKYGEKYERYKKIRHVLAAAKFWQRKYDRQHKLPLPPTVESILSTITFDNKDIKLTEHPNKGKIEKYLWVCGTEQQYNLKLTELIERLENQIESNYADRTKKAFGQFGIDWKAMSHALRISYEGLELVKHGTITFPLLQRQYLLDIKHGVIEYEEVSHEISRALTELTELVNKDELSWKYDEDFWNEFIIQEVKGE